MATDSRFVLSLRNITLQRDANTILNNVSWNIARGEHWVVLGANGSGKTSLMLIAALYLHPSAGEVVVEGERLGDPERQCEHSDYPVGPGEPPAKRVIGQADSPLEPAKSCHARGPTARVFERLFERLNEVSDRECPHQAPPTRHRHDQPGARQEAARPGEHAVGPAAQHRSTPPGGRPRRVYTR